MMETIKGVAAVTGASLWSSFWRDVTPDGARHERCHIPGPDRHVADRYWAAFADALAPNARVLDLACGAGVVGCLLLRRRPDLQVTGIDWAGVPIAPVSGLTIHPWVRMEDVPFDDGSFEAAVSLFGIEYGDIELIAEQLCRILKLGARFSFLVHHAESEILHEGGTRRRAIRETLSGKMKAAFLAGNAAAVDQQRQRICSLFPGEASAPMIADHLRRTATRTRAERQASWEKLTRDFAPEIGLLAHLERSAKSATGIGTWLAPLLARMSSISVSVLRSLAGKPIAWCVEGHR